MDGPEQPPTLYEQLPTLYRLHRLGRLEGTDSRWNTVQAGLRTIAREVVERLTRSRQFHGVPLAESIEEVNGELVRKFAGRRFKSDENLIAVLKQTAANDLMTLFRRSRSPCVVTIESRDERVASASAEDANIFADPVEVDLFTEIRRHLIPARFPHYPHVREMLLAHFLATKDYPDPTVLRRMGVRPGELVSVYNSAVVELNVAIQSWHEAMQEAA